MTLNRRRSLRVVRVVQSWSWRLRIAAVCLVSGAAILIYTFGG